jgi:hypothetical protein
MNLARSQYNYTNMLYFTNPYLTTYDMKKGYQQDICCPWQTITMAAPKINYKYFFTK